MLLTPGAVKAPSFLLFPLHRPLVTRLLWERQSALGPFLFMEPALLLLAHSRIYNDCCSVSCKQEAVFNGAMNFPWN
ncbi:hypothetical protein V5799_012741 [Amblyomma americanum]|uniref:Uncharacterized protein n=1 Tax=Amblyomma americanum TaxID=6943 RepID=A0AAQ4E7X9_AMBAM